MPHAARPVGVWVSVLALLFLTLTPAPASLAQGAQCAVLVTIDALRADHVAAHGGPVPTPALDRLAGEGVLVEQAFTPTPSTGPAHASLLTGLHPWRHRVLDNAVALPDAATTLAERAGQGGVRSAAFVSSYLLAERWNFAQGFDHFAFEATETYPWARWKGQSRPFWTRGRETSDRAMTWLTSQAGGGDAPFLLWLHYFDPHTPYAPPPGYAVSPQEPVDLTGKSLPKGVAGWGALERSIRAYRGEVRYVDAQVGRLLERLKLLDLGRCAVVVTSDHGEGLGDHGVLQHGINLFEEQIRVPLIVRAPGIPPGRRLEGPAQLEDLFPTLLALLDQPIPDDLDGVNLLPWLRGRVERSPRAVVVGRRKAYPSRPGLFFERAWPDKWIGQRHAAGEHFALDADPREAAGRVATGAPAFLRAALEVPVYGASNAPAPEID